MTRRHGITSDSYNNLVLDSGAIYTGFTDFGSLGTLLGATRGGATFKRAPTYKDLMYEGIPGQVVGQKHLTMSKVTLEVNIISFTDDNIPLAIPNSKTTDSAITGYTEISEQEWDAAAVHSLTNIALIAQISGSDSPVAIVLDNPIAESDFSLSFKDKAEAVSKWTFSAFYKESVGFDSAPWRIYWLE